MKDNATILKIDNVSIKDYGTTNAKIEITIGERKYSYLTTDLEVAQDAMDIESDSQKASLDYLITMCIFKNDIKYDKFILS